MSRSPSPARGGGRHVPPARGSSLDEAAPPDPDTTHNPFNVQPVETGRRSPYQHHQFQRKSERKVLRARDPQTTHDRL